MNKLSIVIVSFNARHFLSLTLKAVETAISGMQVPVYVVDNNSSDGAASMVSENFPWVTLIANKINVGFSRANNQALEITDSEYVLILNPDTIITPQTLKDCCAYLDANPTAGAIGVRMVDGKGHYLPESKRGLPTPWVAFTHIFGLVNLAPKSKWLGSYHLKYIDEFQTAPIDVLSGAFMFIRRSALVKTGLFDETFFMYGEDIDLSYRLQKEGYTNIYLPTSTIIHFKGESTKRASANYVKIFYQAMLIFYQKHFAKGNAVVYKVSILLTIYLRGFLAIINRLVKVTAPFMADSGLMYIGMYWLKTYWQNNHKRVPGVYPPDFMQIVVPAYIIVWLLATFLSGGYDNQDNSRKPFRLIRGIVLGTVVISALTNFTDDFRFSKALIILGGVWAVFAMLCWRLLLLLFRHKTFSTSNNLQSRVLVVGNPTTFTAVESITKTDANFKPEILKLFSLGHSALDVESLLAEIALFRISEIVLPLGLLSASDILNIIQQPSLHGITFSYTDNSTSVLLASSGKNVAADVVGGKLPLTLLTNRIWRNKRILDIAIAVGIILTWPAICWYYKHPINALGNAFRVLLKRLSWVGTDVPAGFSNVKAFNYVIDITDGFQMLSAEALALSRLYYWQNYTLQSDLNVISKSLKYLGKPIING